MFFHLYTQAIRSTRPPPASAISVAVPNKLLCYRYDWCGSHTCLQISWKWGPLWFFIRFLCILYFSTLTLRPKASLFCLISIFTPQWLISYTILPGHVNIERRPIKKEKYTTNTRACLRILGKLVTLCLPATFLHTLFSSSLTFWGERYLYSAVHNCYRQRGSPHKFQLTIH